MIDSESLCEAVRAFTTEQRVASVAAGIVAEGRLAWWYASGYADLNGVRPDQHTLYRIASITKTFTAAAVLRLRDDGRLRLDDPLVTHLPEAAAIQNRFGPVSDVTLRRMLCHTSGLQSEAPMDDLRALPLGSIAECVERLAGVRVVIPPDTQNKYSNLAFQLLGAVVERVSGSEYQRYIEQSFLQPLGMYETAFHPASERCATGYDPRLYSDRLAKAMTFDSNDFAADGGLWSSVSDLARWVAFFAGGEAPDVLAVSTRAESLRPWILINDVGSEAQGLCWYSTSRDGRRVVGHEGGWHGFSSRIAISPDQGLGIVVLINTVTDPDPLIFELLARAQLPGPAPAKPPPPTPPPPAVAALLGCYRQPGWAWPARIEWRQDRLVMIDDDGTLPLGPTDQPGVYSIPSGRGAGELVVFLTDDQSRVDGANIAGFYHQREAAG